MADDFVNERLQSGLRWTREVLIWKLDGLSEYDVRRPLTATGVNLPLPRAVAGVAGLRRQRPLGDSGRDAGGHIDAVGHVPWWPRPETKLFDVLIHVLSETTRHAGHADVLREGLDGRTGMAAAYEEPIDEDARAAYFAKVEQAARAAEARAAARAEAGA
ncbi:DinB family protein [Catenulispora subtropica]|uniref:DinB family protein n=1 Tax=Catenulispora subtropica TaxID=450798 RepID=A0ABP5C7U2_9ACTN